MRMLRITRCARQRRWPAARPRSSVREHARALSRLVSDELDNATHLLSEPRPDDDVVIGCVAFDVDEELIEPRLHEDLQQADADLVETSDCLLTAARFPAATRPCCAR
jgi:hypothetical protein